MSATVRAMCVQCANNYRDSLNALQAKTDIFMCNILWDGVLCSVFGGWPRPYIATLVVALRFAGMLDVLDGLGKSLLCDDCNRQMPTALVGYVAAAIGGL